MTDRRLLVAALALGLLTAQPLLAGDDHSHDHDHKDDAEAHLSEKDGVRILHAWTNATDGDSARIYMEIANESGQDVILLGGESEIGAGVALMGAPIRAGEDAPLPLDPFPIAAGTEMDLEPATLFLMIEGLTRTLAEGDDFDMHVELDPIGEIEIHVAVESANAREHSHAGHDH